MDPIRSSAEETIAKLLERAKVSGDRFVVKVSRRRGMAGLLEHIATLVEATVEHVANPETWLPLMCGGGDYGLRVSHMDDVSTAIGSVLTFKFQGLALDTPNVRVVGGKGWTGPGQCIFPAMTESGLPNGSTTGATVTIGAGYGVPGQGVQGGVPGVPSFPAQAWPWDERLERERERVARETRELSERQAKVDRQMAEREFEVREKEREAKLKDELTAKQRELEAKISAQSQSQTKLTDVMTALAPVLGAFLQSQQQARLEMMKMQDESARRQTEMMQAMMSQQQTMMLKLTENKGGVDPTMAAMLEMMRTNASGGAEMMTRIVDAMGTVSKTSVGMIEAIADLQLGGQPEHPILLAVREGVKAMAALSKGAETGARKSVQSQAKLPAQAQSHGTNGAHAQVQQAAPAAVLARPNAPAPNMPPASELSGQQAFDGYAAGQAGRLVPVEGEIITLLKALIESRHEPVEEVAQFFVDSLRTQEMQTELAAHNGDVNSLIAQHLGLWAMAEEQNRVYLGKLGAAVDKLGAALGLVEDEGEPDSEEEADEA